MDHKKKQTIDSHHQACIQKQRGKNTIRSIRSKLLTVCVRVCVSVGGCCLLIELAWKMGNATAVESTTSIKFLNVVDKIRKWNGTAEIETNFKKRVDMVDHKVLSRVRDYQTY
jgi:hypothetical protein